MSQKYVIVHLIDIVDVPEEFPMTEWPLHVTLLANFHIEQSNKLKDALASCAKRIKPFTIAANGEALFGPNQNVAVSLIQADKEIMELHSELLAMATGLGAVFDEPAFTGQGFRPHATIQLKSRLQDQQTVRLDALTLVDLCPNHDTGRRKIIETYPLSYYVHMNSLPFPFDSFRLEKRAGEYKDFGVSGDNPYPLKGVTYPVDYGDIPGYIGEDNANLDVFMGNKGGEILGYIKVFRPDLPEGEHKFYVNLSEDEEEALLNEFGPVILSHSRFDSYGDLLAAIEPFARQG